MLVLLDESLAMNHRPSPDLRQGQPLRLCVHGRGVVPREQAAPRRRPSLGAFFVGQRQAQSILELV